MPKTAEGATILKYGIEMPKGINVLEAELLAFRCGGDLGAPEHFRRAASILWGPDNSQKQFIWHPWADDMLEASCAHQWVALSGAASCGKTDFSAVWGIINFLSRPTGTQVICLSTTIEQSRKRIWGAICSYWANAKHRLPGKVLGKTIRPWDGTNQRLPDDRGITLFAAEKKKEREAAAQLIGIKAPRVLVLADELPELSEAVLEASITNLSTNPYFHFMGMGNHKSIHDAFGKFSKPKGGWGAVTVDDERWETDLGVTLHFDALKHPNWIAQENLFPGVRFEKVQQALDSPALGPNSPGFWRMFRSFPCPTGEEHVLYSEADFIKFQVEEVPVWQGPITKLAALDPAFVSGGDRAVLHYAVLGVTREGVLTLCYSGYDELNEDVTLKDVPRDYQIVQQFKERCIGRGIAPNAAAFDATGAGSVLGSIIQREWSLDVLAIQFGGSASDRLVGENPAVPAKERYANRVSEIWGVGVEFLHNNQLRGMSSALQAELSARQYTLVKGNTMRIQVESKRDMKLRTGKSPDIADAAMILIDLARQRFGFGAGSTTAPARAADWSKMMKRMDVAGAGGRNRLGVRR